MRRGDIHRFRLPKGVGREQQGPRFGVTDELLPRSVIIVAHTSRRARPASFRPEIRLGGETTRVLIEQLRAVDVQRLGRRAGRVTNQELWDVDEPWLPSWDL